MSSYAVRCTDEEDLLACVEDLHGAGMKVEKWRRGYLATQPRKGKVWVHLLLAASTWGLGNLVYLAVLRRQGRRVYLRVERGIPLKLPE